MKKRASSATSPPPGISKKSWPYLLLALLLVATLLVKMCRRNGSNRPTPAQQEEVVKDRPQPGPSPADGPAREEQFNRRVARLSYSQHARCRMGCRHIDESEVKEILAGGRINMTKSEPDNPRSPRYALEGTTHDRQRVRIVFAQDASGTTVVTVIDLDTDWSCDCK